MRHPIKHISVRSSAELHAALSLYRETTWVFRGHADASWRLVPKIGRGAFKDVDERAFFENWKRRAIELLGTPPSDDWDWLTIAQHHGLATRLLDWSGNPLVAAFFAVCEECSGPAHLYALQPKTEVNRERATDPMTFSGVAMLRPRAITARITRQFGLFSVHGEPASPIESLLGSGAALECMEIDSSFRDELRIELDRYGVNKASLFPDLDGLSEYLNWYDLERAAASRRGELAIDETLSDHANDEFIVRFRQSSGE